MHSSQELTSEMFKIEVDGKPISSIGELISGFSSQDRLGIIIYEPLAAIECSGLMAAMVTAFYDEKRKEGNQFLIYPDYFIFFAGCSTVDYGMLDVWPSHKMVEVKNEPEEILRAINDRAITILIITKASQREIKLEIQTRNSALARLKQVFQCECNDPMKDAAVRIESNSLVEKYVQHILSHNDIFTEEERTMLCLKRKNKLKNGLSIEWYKRISPEKALEYL